jgi:tetratricopeptide (TPR) repeat protein
MTSFMCPLRGRRWTRLCALSLASLVLLILERAQAQQPIAADDLPFRVETASSVDENLFVLYTLGSLYQRLPAADASSATKSEWINATRAQAQSMRSLIRSRQIDPVLDDLYRDCLDFTQAYEAFLERTEQIRKQRDQYEMSDVLDSAIKAYKNGSDVHEAASALGASDDHASFAGSVAGILSGMADIYSRNQQRDSAANAAVAAEARSLSERLSSVNENAHAVSALLAKRYGWAQPEADFDTLSSPSIGLFTKQMPRNPFAACAPTNNLRNGEPFDEVMRGALICFQAAEMVPADAGYERYRQLFLYQAAALAVRAASTAADTPSDRAILLQTSVYAVKSVRTYLSRGATADGGAGYLLLSSALEVSGRYADAVAADNTAFQLAPGNQNDMSTALRHAGLLSLTGSLDDSAKWLARAFSLGFHDLAWLRQDPDLDNLRRLRPISYQYLTTVQLSGPQFIWGILLDDVELRNNSPFDVTNLSARVIVYKAGRVYTANVQCPVVKAGGICRVNNAVSIPGDSYDGLRWSFTSDQGAS